MYSIGIDLGGTNIVASVVDDKYNIIATSKTPTSAPRTADEIFDDIAMVSQEAVQKAELTMADIDSVGMGTPGTVNGEGIIEFANNLATPFSQSELDKGRRRRPPPSFSPPPPSPFSLWE